MSRVTTKGMEELSTLPPHDIASAIAELPVEEIILILKSLPSETSGAILAELPRDVQMEIFRAMNTGEFASIYVNMPPEERIDFYQSLSSEEQARLIPFLPIKVREETIRLSKYSEETAGGIMTTNFAIVKPDMTVQQAIDYLREHAPRKMVYYIYVTDEDERLIGVITLRDLLLSPPDKKIRDIMYSGRIIKAYLNEDREEAVRKIDEYDLIAIPVVNDQDQLVGIITYEQALDTLREEQTEDVEKIMGIFPEEAPREQLYKNIPLLVHIRKRLPWLVLLAILNLLSAYVLSAFRDVIATETYLIFFLPLIGSIGGNSASQTSATIIRALALKELDISKWWLVVVKELGIGALLGVCLSLIAALEVYVVLYFSGGLEYKFGYIIQVVAIAALVQVVIATGLGASLPLILEWLGIDPAVASSPLLATMLDITGITVYFLIAMMVLPVHL